MSTHFTNLHVTKGESIMVLKLDNKDITYCPSLKSAVNCIAGKNVSEALCLLGIPTYPETWWCTRRSSYQSELSFTGQRRTIYFESEGVIFNIWMQLRVKTSKYSHHHRVRFSCHLWAKWVSRDIKKATHLVAYIRRSVRWQHYYKRISWVKCPLPSRRWWRPTLNPLDDLSRLESSRWEPHTQALEWNKTKELEDAYRSGQDRTYISAMQ